LCRIAAPTFFEQKRAEWIAARFRELEWEAKIDRAGNVIASLERRRDSPSIAVTAHLDTVLAPRTPEDIKVAGDGKLFGPGVSDNGAGLSALLAPAPAARRFYVTITVPGGHSWSDYGVGNPVHALARAVTLFTDRVPSAGP